MNWQDERLRRYQNQKKYAGFLIALSALLFPSRRLKRPAGMLGVEINSSLGI